MVVKDHPGVLVTVKALPIVEEFMRSLGNGTKVAVETVGRQWTPAFKGQVLEVYHMDSSNSAGMQYSLSYVGSSLVTDDLPNLSILRLVGIGSEEGVTFGIKSVYSLPRLRQVRDLLIESSRAFYLDYVRPVTLKASVMADEQVG
jgi:hypothetical protein